MDYEDCPDLKPDPTIDDLFWGRCHCQPPCATCGMGRHTEPHAPVWPGSPYPWSHFYLGPLLEAEAS